MGKFFWLRVALLLQLFSPEHLRGQDLPSTQNDNSCVAALGGLGRMSLDEMRAEVRQLKKMKDVPADSYFKGAEMMKRLGDYDASDYYERALHADRSEPSFSVKARAFGLEHSGRAYEHAG